MRAETTVCHRGHPVCLGCVHTAATPPWAVCRVLIQSTRSQPTGAGGQHHAEPWTVGSAHTPTVKASGVGHG